MKTRLFATSAILVGLTLVLIVVGDVRSATAQIQQSSLPAPTPASDHFQVTMTLRMALQAPITSVTPITDVGQFTSGARYCDSNCRAALGLADVDEWPVFPTGSEMDTAIPCAYPLPDGMCIYYGDLHSHTKYSDGKGTPEQAYQMARANGLDFFATTDHAEQLSKSEWNATLAQAQAATVEDHFVALRGFEWTSKRGHLNIFNTNKRVRATDSRYNTPRKLYAWLSDPARINSVAQFDHPFYPKDPFDNWRYDLLADRHVSLIETHNGNISAVREYGVALAAGWHVGAASNSDTHWANWGERRARTGIVAPGLTYHHVIDALRARRTFSTDDENLVLAMRANGYWMGSVIRNGLIYFDIYAFDPDPADPIAALELIQNGYPFRSTVINTNAFTWSFSLPVPPPPGTWWYAKATQTDGDEVYTSPIWTHQPEPYDVLIRDNVWDVGDVPSADPAWQSPDIWVRHQADGQIWHENPVVGETNHVYARVQNVGSNPLTDVDVYFYWAAPSLGFVWPESWHPITSTPAHIHNLAPDEVTTVSIPWDASDSVPRHACLLVRLASTQDPIHYEGYPKWDSNISWRNVHILDADDISPPGTLIFPSIEFYLANPFAEAKTADVRISSNDFPVEGSITLYLDPELFDRWIITDTSSLVKGAVVDPISRTIAITFPVDATVYRLPLQAGEVSTATFALHAPPTSTLAVHVTEQIDGEEIGGNLYTTSPSGVPRKVSLEADADRIALGGTVVITATVVGDASVLVADGTEVHFSTTQGSLSADTAQTQNGIVTVTLSTGTIPGTAIVRAGVNDLVSAATAVNIYPTCWVRLNDEPTEYFTIQAAVDASTHPTDVIKAAGRCTMINAHGGLSQVVYISKTVTVRGGYTTTNWTTADPVANHTTLDAEGQGRVFYITGAPAPGADISPTIEGLRITGGDADGLGGGPPGRDTGGGVYVISATATIRNNQVLNNTAEDGGGLYLSSDCVTLVNNVVADNQGGGLYIRGGSPRLLHTTIARNGSGIYVTNSGSNYSTVALTNTILVSHTVGITVTAGNTATLESTLWGNGVWVNSTDWGGAGAIISGTHNYWSDPDFAESGTGGYRIGVDSAALDAGVDAGVNDDVDGESRPMGHGYDIGADELRIELMVTKQAVVGTALDETQLTYTIRVTNTGNMDLHIIVTDTLPSHIMPGETASGTLIVPGGTLTWSPVITLTGVGAPGGVWTQQVAVTVEKGYVGPLTNVVQVSTDEGATGIYTHTLVLTPDLEVTVQATPDPVRPGEPLAYTIYVTNTGDVALHAVVTDVLPTHIIPSETAGGTLIGPAWTITWTGIITAPGGVWTQPVVVTVEMDYGGPLTNVVQVATDEGAMGVYTEITTAIPEYHLHMPLAMRNFSTPEPCAPQLITTVGTGPDSYGVALDTANRRAFIAHADGITVVDIDDFAVITVTRSFTSAHGIAYDPDHDRIWVTLKDLDRVVVLDGATYATIANLSASDGPHSVAYNPANGRVYVSNYVSDRVGVYDAETPARLAELTGFAEPAHLAVNPITNKIYVANHKPNEGVMVIDGTTHSSHRVSTTLLDAYGVAVDTTRNLVYATAIAQGRIAIIDGATDVQLGDWDIRRGDGHSVWLRVIAVNPNVGPEGHLLLVTSSDDGELDQLLLIPNGWPTLGTPVPLDIASYPQEGIILDPNGNRVWVTSVSGGLVSVVQDGELVCSIPFSASTLAGENDSASRSDE